VTEFFNVDGAKGYLFQGVFFTEAYPSSATSIRECSTTSNVQNTNLDWLREKLATQVKGLGGNALIGFKYVQKANIFSFSSVSWTASGTAAAIVDLSRHRDVQDQPDPLAKKPCPYCAEEIMAVAKKCKHCGEFLN